MTGQLKAVGEALCGLGIAVHTGRESQKYRFPVKVFGTCLGPSYLG